MLEFLVRPLRSALGVAEHEATAPLVGAERELGEAVDAIHRASDSVERHIEVIEGLATSVEPLTESVNRLTATVAGLTTLLAPLAKAEHEVQQIERRFGFRRRAAAVSVQPGETEAGATTPQPGDEAD